MAGYQAIEFLGRNQKGCVLHAQRLADVPLEVLLERETAHFLDQLSCPIRAVAVMPARPRIKHQRDEWRNANRWRAAMFFILDHVAAPGVVAEPGSVRQQLTKCDRRARRSKL